MSQFRDSLNHLVNHTRAGGILLPVFLVLALITQYVCLWKLFFWTVSFSLPSPLFSTPCSPTLLDQSAEIISVRIAKDEQWRVCSDKEVQEYEKYTRALLLFEDKRFFLHPGVDPLSVGRALLSNLRNAGVVSGASTISMQVIRLSEQNPPRTLLQKTKEMLLALALEQKYTKQEILRFYMNHAPMGGNVVGLESASLRYFGRSARTLSWAEAALFTVLPNNPGLLHPGAASTKSHTKLKTKRDRLLRALFQQSLLDSLQLQLSLAESIPQSIHPMPASAVHYLNTLHKKQNKLSALYTSPLNRSLQDRVQTLVNEYQKQLRRQEIHTVAVVIRDNRTGKIKAYSGNATNFDSEHRFAWVDHASAPRSSGSILKPFLYTWMLEAGELYPNTLIKDIPTRYKSFSPRNYNRGYSGVVPANEALIRSLNIPAVRMLQNYGLDRFYDKLKQAGITTLHRPAEKYGLTLIIGGAETTLLEVTDLYQDFALALLSQKNDSSTVPAFSPQGSWLALQALQNVNRPGLEQHWKQFASSKQVAWKTGTSFGHRDAWAVGVTPEYTIGVLAGNANGEGRPEIVGLETAAPLLFQIINLFPRKAWFRAPPERLRNPHLARPEKVQLCPGSGYPRGPHCPLPTSKTHPEFMKRKSEFILASTHVRLPSCPYHRTIHLDSLQQFRVHAECYDPGAIRQTPWMQLSPVEEFYHTQTNSKFKKLPPWLPGCVVDENSKHATNPISLVYPTPGVDIYLPVDINHKQQHLVFQLAHRSPKVKVHWHLNEMYLGTSEGMNHQHKMQLRPEEGEHTLTVVDENGHRVTRKFRILSQKK